MFKKIWCFRSWKCIMKVCRENACTKAFPSFILSSTNAVISIRLVQISSIIRIHHCWETPDMEILSAYLCTFNNMSNFWCHLSEFEDAKITIREFFFWIFRIFVCFIHSLYYILSFVRTFSRIYHWCSYLYIGMYAIVYLTISWNDE